MNDMMGNPQQINLEVLKKEKELFSKIKDNYKTIQQRTNIINESQLESLNLNLKTTHKFFTPENLITKNPKGIDQLYALVVNMKKELNEKVPEDNLAINFLSNQGITLTKIEKEIADLKNYVQTRYDLTTDMKKISVSEKFFFGDEKFFQNIQTMSLRKAINETVQHSQKIKKNNKVSGISFYQKMIGLQFEDVRKLETTARISEDGMGENHGYISGHIGLKSGFSTNRKGYEPSSFSKSGHTMNSFTPMKNKNFSNNIIGMKIGNQSAMKQIDNTNASSLILNNLRKTRNILNLNQDESIVQLFDAYFDNMKFYFYYKSKNEMVTDNNNFIFNHSDISKFNSSTNKTNLYPLIYTISSLINHFSQVNKDNSRKNFFDLFLHQITPSNFYSCNIMDLTVNQMLKNTTSYYEQEFLRKVLNLSGENLIRIELNNIDYGTKLRAIENYVNSIIYGKLLISSTDRNIEEIEKLRLWGMIYYLLRCGLEEECLKFIVENSKNFSHDIEISYFHSILTQIIRDTPINLDLYAQIMDGIKNKSESEINPFRHCCFVLVTKISQTVNELILENLEDYIWFHLKLIIESNNFNILKEENVLNAKFYTLKEFQDYIRRSAPDNFESSSNQVQLDYAKCLFSILLFEDGLKSLGQSDENLVDTVNISLILKELRLLRNFHTIEKKNVYESSLVHDENDYITNRWVETFAETFMNSRMFPVLNYMKCIYKGNLFEKISNIINNTGKYKSLLNPEDSFFVISRDKKINLLDLLEEKGITSLVSQVVRDSIHTSTENRSNYETVILLAKKFKMYNELLELIINDSVEILTLKTPKKIYKSQIHLKASLVNKFHTDLMYDVKFSQKYKSILEEIGGNIANFENSFRINFKYLRQLETIETIYELINTNMEGKALDMFNKYVSLIPYKNDKEIAQFMNNEYVYINDLMKNIYPDILYLLFYLLSSRITELNTSFNLRRNENIQSVKNEIDQYKAFISNISHFVEKLSCYKVIKTADRYKEIMRLINDFTLKY